MNICDRIIRFLDSAPTDEVFTLVELGKKLGFVRDGNIPMLIPENYKARFPAPRPKLVFGHPDAIKAAKESYENR